MKPCRLAVGDTPQTIAPRSLDRHDAIAVPGAATSGFQRPSRVGPVLEKVARLPAAGCPKVVLTGEFQAAARQSVQFCLVIQAAVANVFWPQASPFTSMWAGSSPITKLALNAVLLWKYRHWSTRPLAAPSETAVKVNVQVPAMFIAAPTLLITSMYTSREPLAVVLRPFST